MPYKSSMSAPGKGMSTETNQSRLAMGAKIYDDDEDGVDSTSAPDPPTALPTFTMNTAAGYENPQQNGTKVSLSSRRRQSSIPSVKSLMGPRPLDLQLNNKRTVSSTSHQYGSQRGSSTVNSQTSCADEYSNEVSQFSFATIDPMQTVPQYRRKEEEGMHVPNFLEPKFDFDDFQDNLVASSPHLDTFPLSSLSSQFEVPDVPVMPKAESKKLSGQPAIPVPSRKVSGAGSIGRKGSTASTTSRLSISRADPMAQTMTGTTPALANTSVLRGRRQTHFPPNAFNNIPSPAPTTKTPRKSIGPGTFVVPGTEEKRADVKRRPSINGRKSSADSNKSGVSIRVVNRDVSKSPNTVRAKSIYGPNRGANKDLSTPSKTPDGIRTASLNVQSTPNRRSGTPGRTTTPGATNRRQSVATGLGARTISPTDARRLKRMSMVPPAPPLPASRISQAPPTPQPDLVLPAPPQSTTQSPGGGGQSMTPSSSRTTPDPNRKSYSSGQSLSSNTTYGSTRNSASMSAKLAQNNTSSSRLPTPKPRVETENSPAGEEIPPVPAIPKSYESPASEIDQPFFSARSSSLQQLDTPASEKSMNVTAAEAFARLNLPDEFNDSLLLEDHDFGLKSKPSQGLDQFDMSGRVPPLGLLPISGSTASKIKAFKESANVRPVTPPDEYHKINPPTTPMTASKASFFTKNNQSGESNHSKMARSNTSHFVARSSEPTIPTQVSPGLPSLPFETDTSSNRSISPFLSTSAPKSSNEFPNYMRSNFSTELRRTATQARPNGPRAPSYSISARVNDSTPSSEKNSEGSATASSTSVNRALGRKKSDSKLLESASANGDQNKHGHMPPPKLPASATWSNLSSKASSPTQKPGFFKSRRKTSASSTHTLNTFGLDHKDSVEATKSPVAVGRPSIDSMRSFMLQSNKSASVLNSAIPSKPVRSRTQESELDRDDMIAEEEMRKLASKRRDFESAARQLDALRARARAVDRVSPDFALKSVNLNIFERGEIVDFPDIYFAGTKHSKKIVGDLGTSSSNFGYDDDRGDYNIVEGDHLAYRYEVVDVLGKGSFGQVVRCVDHKTGILVAIKIIRNKKRFHQQALVEVDILQKLKEWDPEKKHNVVNFDQSFYFRGHLCISTDLLNMNLYEFIKAHDFRGFSLKLIRRFTKQMLGSLILLHGKKVIHCDLKPENILLAHPAHSEIKVIDFGSSCFENEKVYTYIQSRFYRSPEVILGMSYGMPIDMWSLGCILAELYTGYPIFPGENEQEQLACIMEIFGPPEKHLIEKSSRKKLFFDSMGKPRLTVSSKGRRRRPSSKDLRSVLKCDDEAFLDFIARCLRWDPSRRINPHEASRHEFISGIKPAPISARKHIANALGTPLKRGNSVANTGAVRPLPQPPPSSLKPTISIRQDSLAPSPQKAGARRQSNVNSGLQIAPQAKRASHAVMNSSQGSNGSRIGVGQRTTSSRSDLAAAAAAASLMK